MWQKCIAGRQIISTEWPWASYSFSFSSPSPSPSLSLGFNGHFPGEPGLVGVYWSKGWWRWWWQLDYWSYKSCKAPVKSSPPTNKPISAVTFAIQQQHSYYWPVSMTTWVIWCLNSGFYWSKRWQSHALTNETSAWWDTSTVRWL